MNISIINLLRQTLLFLLIIFFRNVSSQVSEEWIHRYTGPESSTDTPNQFVIDESGNMYITGKSILSGGYSDIITVKYNSSGVRQWISKYNGPYNNNDEASSIQVDASGNVYVSGNTRTTLGQYNIVTLKYNTSGVQQWVQQYNGPGNFDDIATDIILDTNGNVYSGGYSYGMGTGYDFVILKYNSSGGLQWTQRWNGTSNLDDYLKKISLASNGDIVISGSSDDINSSFDFITLKYNSAGGLIWTQKYNGTGSSEDQVTKMKIDLQNNIYVCGKSIGSGTGYDYVVVKYNLSGAQQWTTRYNGSSSSDDVPSSLDIDVNGNVFVTGFSYGSTSFFDYATVKYNPGGVQQWVKIYNGIENFFDKAFDIKTDGFGNAYVTGQTIKSSDGTSDVLTIKYNQLGIVQWIEIYNGPGNLDDSPIQMEIDKSGYLYLIANSYSYFFSLCGSSDYLLLKYNSNGNVQWESRYDGSGNGMDEATALTLDNRGNCYVTGFSYNDISNFDYATLKYNSTGAPLWAIRYDGGNGIDKPTSIFVDNNGNVYVTGSSIGIGIGYEIATVKYDSNSHLIWENRYNGTGNGDDYASGLIVDAAGNTFVTGQSDGIGSGKDYVTIKYSSNGAQQWASRYNGPGNSNDNSNFIVLDSLGNIYVTGSSIGIGSMEDIATVKYNSSGSQLWASRFNGVSNNSDQANSIALDKSGNVLITGKSKSVSTDYDIITIKYNSSGVQQWFKTYNGTNNAVDEASSLTTDNDGNIYITGSTINTNTNSDYTTIKYNPAGIQQWVSVYNGSMNSIDKASSICNDIAGNLYVTGFCEDNGSNMNYCTIKYNNNGDLRWNIKYNYIDNDSDKASVVKVDISGNVYVTGFSKGLEGSQDFTTIKYNQDKTIDLKALIEGLYRELTNKMIPDTMKVYLRNITPPFNIVDSSISTLDTFGNGTFTFYNVLNGASYYIVLTHKNSLETWSSSGHSFESSYINYDFTNSASQAYGNNLVQIGNKFCIYSGDANKDGAIDIGDVSIIDNEIFNFASGYNLADLNGDQIVDISDMGIADNNTFNFIVLIRP